MGCIAEMITDKGEDTDGRNRRLVNQLVMNFIN
jgi:hypothetical protein